MSSDTSSSRDSFAPRYSRREELFAFIVLAVLIWPIIAVGIVGGYGFTSGCLRSYSALPGPPRH